MSEFFISKIIPLYLSRVNALFGRKKRYSIFIREPDNYLLTCDFANTRMPAQSIL
jgi:hypothetical protein